MSRRVRVNLRRWLCKHLGHRTEHWGSFLVCSRCDRLLQWNEPRCATCTHWHELDTHPGTGECRVRPAPLHAHTGPIHPCTDVTHRCGRHTPKETTR